MKFFCDPQRCFFSLPCYVVIGLHDKNVKSFGIWPEYFIDQGILAFSQLLITPAVVPKRRTLFEMIF